MGDLVEIRNYIPEPHTRQKMTGKTFARKTTSFVAALGLILSAAAPFPAVKSENDSKITGWGNSCTPEGIHMYLAQPFRKPDGKIEQVVTVFECKSKGDGRTLWYNGNIYPRSTSK